MNRKFFTLIAGFFMLAASLGTVSALNSGTPTAKLDAAAQKNGLYQLAAHRAADQATKYVLWVDDEGVLKATEVSAYSEVIGKSLWCISVTGEEQGANPRFDFVNRAFGAELAVSYEDYEATGKVTISNGDGKGWRFSPVYKTGLLGDLTLSTYNEADKVLVLELEDGSDVVKVSQRIAQTDGEYGGDDVLYFTIWNPAAIRLKADDFNSRLQTEKNDSIKLKFDKDRNNTKVINPWTDLALKAEPSQVDGYLYFKRASRTDQYLRVDTGWVNDFGEKFLAFAFGDKDKPNEHGNLDISDQYLFSAYYTFNDDQIDLRVKSAYLKGENDKLWANATQETDDSKLRVKLQDLSTIDEVRIVTIGEAPINTKITLGVSKCAVSENNLASVGSDLYVITNDQGQTLIVPIYTIGWGGEARWVKLPENVNATKIPAYQWVVEQLRETNLDQSPIKITNREYPGINFGSLQLRKDAGVELFGAKIKPANFGTALPASIKKDSLLGYFHIDSITAATYSYSFNYLHKYRDDQFLGINEGIKDSSLYVNDKETQFKFLPIKTDIYDDKGNYLYTGYQLENYGYTTKKVKDLAQLQRIGYTVQVKTVGEDLNTTYEWIVVDSEDRYAISSKLNNGYRRFYLKTNNTKEGTDKDYYALLNITHFDWSPADKNIYSTLRGTKVGIDDNSLWAYKQILEETRTSAFAIEKFSEPIYRRFDGVTTGKKEVEEPFGTKSNAPVWLKFTKSNNWSKEFLAENSPLGLGNNYPTTTENDYRVGIVDTSLSVLGLYNIDQYPERGDKFNYTFYVDTAYVRAETPMPQYMLALRPVIQEADTIYYKGEGAWYDKDGHIIEPDPESTAIRILPALVRGLYLFNAQDSVGYDNTSPVNPDYVGKRVYGAPDLTRLAFVDGIHMADTFYVLRDKFKGVNTKDIKEADLHAIPEGDKLYLGENTHYDPRWYTYEYNDDSWDDYYTWNGSAWVYDLKKAPAYLPERNGKSMVFQFRLVDPTNNRRFAIESQRKIERFRVVHSYEPVVASEIEPATGRFVKIQNGVPVLTDNVDWQSYGQNGIEIFDVLQGDEKLAVANEATPEAVSAVKVISEVGALNILNAAGKKVTVSNILGQTVAGATLASDNARITLPKGIVIVAVEGEAAVKAIVK